MEPGAYKKWVCGMLKIFHFSANFGILKIFRPLIMKQKKNPIEKPIDGFLFYISEPVNYSPLYQIFSHKRDKHSFKK